MQQTTPTLDGDKPNNPLDTTGLCLLSLDGGGVRGLSTLYILQSIMDQLNHARKSVRRPPVKPCEVFDLIGGTSTGGLIAIMLGRLEMDVDECIAAYGDLAETVFSEKKSRRAVTLKGKVNARFDSAKLEKAILDTIKRTNFSETDLFNDGNERGCKTFVCAADHYNRRIVRLRSYVLPNERNIPATICQAGLATSAATSFFEPVRIGNRMFADGGLGANNPVQEVEGEAANIWCSDSGELKPLVKCFISIGTGSPESKAYEESILKFLGETVVGIAAETEETERRFIADWRKQLDENRYFRFNVDQGLQSIGLDEYKQQGAIESATETYLVNQAQKNRLRDCIKNLTLKQNKTKTSFENLLNEFKKINIEQQRVKQKAHWIVPFEKNRNFTGREPELARLEGMLFTEDQTTKIAITGLGGVGKTSLAIELVYLIKEHHKDCSIFWIPATNFESLQKSYFNICKQLQLPGWDKGNADTRMLLQTYLSQASAGQWVLLFDNADDISMWIESPANEHQSRPLMEYLPKSQEGHIIFTTRDRKTAYEFVQREQRIVEVTELGEAVAIGLLQKYTPNHDLVKYEEDANSLLRQLTYLPLAIVQAASFINKNRIPLAEYLLLLADQEEEVVDLLSQDFEDEGRYRDVKNPVATTWLISFEQIRCRDPWAAKLLSFISCVESKDVPQSLLPPGPSRMTSTEALGTLEAYSFINVRQADSSLDIHRLVRLAIRNWLRERDLLVQCTQTALARVDDLFPNDDPQNRSIWRKYLSHARCLLDSPLIDQYGVRRIELAFKVGLCLRSDGRWKEAEDLSLQVVKSRKKRFGLEHPSTLESINSLAICLNVQGNNKEAEPIFRKTLQLREKILGQEHPDTLESINNLASYFYIQGNYKEAEPLFRKTLQQREKILGQEHPSTLESISSLAICLNVQGNNKEAEPLFRKTLQLQEKILGQEHPDTLESINSLAICFYTQGNNKEAEPLFRKTLQQREKILGQEHPSTLRSISNLATCLYIQGNNKEAEPLFRKTLQLREKILGQEHPSTLRSINNLATYLYIQGNYKEAEPLFRKTLQLREKILGQEHPSTLRSISNLASYLDMQSKSA